ncbi:MAG: DUF4245 domain-containing protein [Actinomycetota bacterium]
MSNPDTAPVPVVQQPRPGRGPGNVRSLVISLAVLMVAVVAWLAIVPRVSEISRPAVDVASVARQVRNETGWAISEPRLPAGWKATNARFDSAGDGIRTWHAGYLSPDGQYFAIDQTEVTGASDSWVAGRTSHGQADGTVSTAGRMWQKLSSRDIVQRSLVSKGSGAGELTTVLSGTAPYAQLAQFAQTLKPVPVPSN